MIEQQYTVCRMCMNMGSNSRIYIYIVIYSMYEYSSAIMYGYRMLM